MTKLTHSTLSGFFWMFLGSGAQAILQLVVLIILARLLTPSDFGVVAAALVVLGFTSIFSQLGVGPAIVQRSSLETEHLQTAFTLSLLFGISLTGLIWLLAPTISGFFRIVELTPIVRLMSIMFVFQSLSIVAESILQRELKFRRLATIEVIAFAIGFGAVGIILAYLGHGVWALVGAYLTQTFLKTVILLFVQTHPKKPKIHKQAFIDLMTFGGGFTLARIGNYVAGQGDNLVVGRYLGPEALGIYGRSYQLMSVPASLFGQVVDKVLFPVMAKVQHHPERLAMAFRRGVALIALMILPTSAVLFFLAPEVVLIMLGSEWNGVVVPFQIFAVGMLFRTSYKMSDSISRATGAVYRRAWRQGIYALMVIGGAYYGQCWGLAGVAFGVLGAITINFLLMAELSLILAKMKWSSFITAHGSAIFLTLILGPETWWLAKSLRELNYSPVELLVISTTVVLMTFFLLARLMPRFALGKDGIWMLQMMLAYLPSNRKK